MLSPTLAEYVPLRICQIFKDDILMSCQGIAWNSRQSHEHPTPVRMNGEQGMFSGDRKTPKRSEKLLQVRAVIPKRRATEFSCKFECL
ncbi:hypothetical protein X739_12120 [Mesorhizobium sp. LNHC220B00]|nr:hypothetical protein X739_12120 [Mesorhizobium sp. LNHC220B00]